MVAVKVEVFRKVVGRRLGALTADGWSLCLLSVIRDVKQWAGWFGWVIEMINGLVEVIVPEEACADTVCVCVFAMQEKSCLCQSRSVVCR